MCYTIAFENLRNMKLANPFTLQFLAICCSLLTIRTKRKHPKVQISPHADLTTNAG